MASLDISFVSAFHRYFFRVDYCRSADRGLKSEVAIIILFNRHFEDTRTGTTYLHGLLDDASETLQRDKQSQVIDNGHDFAIFAIFTPVIVDEIKSAII